MNEDKPMDDMKKSVERADILLEALPYIRRFYSKTDRDQVRRPCDGG